MLRLATKMPPEFGPDVFHKKVTWEIAPPGTTTIQPHRSHRHKQRRRFNRNRFDVPSRIRYDWLHYAGLVTWLANASAYGLLRLYLWLIVPFT